MIAMTIQITETSHLKGRDSDEIRMKFGWDYDDIEQNFGCYCISNLNGRLQVFFLGFLIEIWFKFFEPLFLKFCKFKQSVINLMWYFNNANISLVKQFIHVFQFSSAIFMLLPQMIWKSWLSFSCSSYDIGGSRLDWMNLIWNPLKKKIYILRQVSGPKYKKKKSTSQSGFFYFPRSLSIFRE